MKLIYSTQYHQNVHLEQKLYIFSVKSRFLATQEELEAPLWIWFTLDILLLIFQQKKHFKKYFSQKNINNHP